MNTAFSPQGSDLLKGTESRRLRRLVAAAFTPHRTEQLCVALRSTVRPDPASVVCSALRVPSEELATFSRWAEELTKPTSEGTFRGALFDLYARTDVMVADRCRDLRDDLLSDLIMVKVDGDELDSGELQMLVAGAFIDLTGNCFGAHLAQIFRTANES